MWLAVPVNLAGFVRYFAARETITASNRKNCLSHAWLPQNSLNSLRPDLTVVVDWMLKKQNKFLSIPRVVSIRSTEKQRKETKPRGTWLVIGHNRRDVHDAVYHPRVQFPDAFGMAA